MYLSWLSRWAIRVGTAVLLMSFSGCAQKVYSPPASLMPLQTAAAARVGETGVGIQGLTAGEVFGPSILAATIRVKHGIVEGLEGIGEVTAATVADTPAQNNDTSPVGGTSQLAVKFQLAPPLAVFGGVGGGVSAAGWFISPDAGAVLAFENPYFVPYVLGRFALSTPIDPRQVNLAEPPEWGEDGEDVPPVWATPRTTGYTQLIVGFRVPLGWNPRDRVRGSIINGIGWTHAFDDRQSSNYFMASAALEIAFL